MTNSNEKKKQLYIEHYYRLVETMACPAYLLKNATDFPILAANQAFYRMIGVSEQEVDLKYGGRLAAIIDAAPYYRMISRTEVLPPFVHKSGEKEKARSFFTSIQKPGDNDEVLFCISYELTDYVKSQNLLAHISDMDQFIADRINLEIFEWNVESGIVTIYTGSDVLGGLEKKEKIEDFKTHLKKFFAGGSNEDTLEAAFYSVSDLKKEFTCELSKRVAEDKNKWSRISVFDWPSKIKKRGLALGIIEDITQEKELTFNYLRESQFYHMMLSEKVGYGHADITKNKILHMGGIWNIYNEVIHEVTYEELIHTFINKVVHPEDREQYLELMLVSNLEQSYANGISRLGCEFRRIVEQNKMVWMQLGLHLFKEPVSGHLLGLFYLNNIDAEKKQSMQLEYESQRDQLTNIYNKKITETLIREHFRQSDERVISAFILLDLDNFKQINDTYGHRTGDQVLIYLVMALREAFRKNDIVGRFGGDEFVVFLKNIKSEEFIAERLKVLFDRLLAKKDPNISCSAGIALACGGSEYDEVFARADEALYEAKCSGKGRYHFYRGQSGVLDVYEGQIRPVSEAGWDSIGQESNVVQAILESTKENHLFDRFVGEQGDMAYLVDPVNYDLICGNKAFYDRIGVTEKECIGIKCYDAMHKRKAPCPFCSKANWSADKFFIWKDRNSVLEQEFLIKNKLVDWNGNEVLLALAVDVSNNKSMSEFVSNEVSESHVLVSTIQQMEKCENAHETVKSVLDAIGHFFRSDSVEFWEIKPQGRFYECSAVWKRPDVEETFGENENATITQWLRGRQWNGSLFIEKPEEMLGFSFEMYQLMHSHDISGYQWIQLNDCEQEYGCIAVVNGKANIRNDTFLEAMAEFLTSALKKLRMIEKARRAETHDKMTDLFNRSSYEKYLQNYDPDNLICIGVVAANIDNLKGINNSRGYLTGNYYIKRFTKLLVESFEDCALYRLNGDEFVIIAENMERRELELKIFTLTDQMSKDEDYTVSVGYGWDNVEKDINELLAGATHAMHVNKKKHYDSDLLSGNAERGKMLAELLKGIERGAYRIFLQPKFNMEEHRLIGAEALIRHIDEKRGVIPPSEFIPILEANNLVRYVDLFVMDEVCRLQEKWIKKWGVEIIVSLNFSRTTLLEENILENIEDILGQYDILRSCIEIEITESFVAGGKGTLYRVAQDLYDAGCKLSLDDFGVRYTNISMLADIDFHTLKLDKSLIKALGKRESNQIILKNIIRLCNDMQIHVIAEGVETKEQEAVLRNLGCEWGQGYLFGKPMPVEEFEQRYLGT